MKIGTLPNVNSVDPEKQEQQPPVVTPKRGFKRCRGSYGKALKVSFIFNILLLVLFIVAVGFAARYYIKSCEMKKDMEKMLNRWEISHKFDEEFLKCTRKCNRGRLEWNDFHRDSSRWDSHHDSSHGSHERYND